jgi:hypothetical protein
MCLFERKLLVMDPIEKYDSNGSTTGESGTEQGRFLKNPLPVPKRRPHVRMEFDLTDDWDLPRGLEHFDIEISDDDDFDI